MANSIVFRSSANSSAIYQRETYTNSGVFENIEPFTPTVADVIFDPDELTYELRNFTLGTKLRFVYRNERSSRVYLHDGNYALLETAGPINSAFDSNYVHFYLFPRPSSWASNWRTPIILNRNSTTEINGYLASNDGADLYVGAFYHRDRQMLVFFACDDNGGYRCSNFDVNDANYGQALEMFYGSDYVDKLSLQRVSPPDYRFSIGQSSQLEYKLMNDAGQSVEAVVTYDPLGLENGWEWDESTHTLTYKTGSARQMIAVETSYDGVDYKVNAIFSPPTGTSPYQPGGTSGSQGGNGNFGQGESSDNVTGGVPSGSSEQPLGKAGLYTRYLLNPSQLANVGTVLWSKNFLQGIENALTKLFYASPADMLIQLMSYPFNIEAMSPSLGLSPVVWGNVTLGIEYPVSVLNSSALSFDWGTVNLSEYWGSFLDYAPYTKMDLYLPFGVGFVPIDPNECMPGSLNIKTNFDMNTGAVVHSVTGTVTRNGITTSTIIGTYCGNAARQIPMISSDVSGKILTLLSSAIGLTLGAVQATSAIETPSLETVPYYDANTGLSGNLSVGEGFEMSRGKFAGEMVKSFAKQLPQTTGAKFATRAAIGAAFPAPVQRNGSFTSGSSGLGVQFPYLVISRPDQSVPEQYGRHYGYPSNIYAQLSTLSGYTEIGSIHLSGIICTGEERNELERLLKGGVILGY